MEDIQKESLSPEILELLQEEARKGVVNDALQQLREIDSAKKLASMSKVQTLSEWRKNYSGEMERTLLDEFDQIAEQEANELFEQRKYKILAKPSDSSVNHYVCSPSKSGIHFTFGKDAEQIGQSNVTLKSVVTENQEQISESPPSYKQPMQYVPYYFHEIYDECSLLRAYKKQYELEVKESRIEYQSQLQKIKQAKEKRESKISEKQDRRQEKHTQERKDKIQKSSKPKYIESFDKKILTRSAKNRKSVHPESSSFSDTNGVCQDDSSIQIMTSIEERSDDHDSDYQEIKQRHQPRKKTCNQVLQAKPSDIQREQVK
jgi:hypothetical protein